MNQGPVQRTLLRIRSVFVLNGDEFASPATRERVAA